MPAIIKNLFKFATAGPAGAPFAITPSDTGQLTTLARFIMVGGAGDVKVQGLDGQTGTLPSCQPGVQYRANAKQVLSTGTSATGIVGIP